jgi:hypothetical protein
MALLASLSASLLSSLDICVISISSNPLRRAETL